MSKRANPKLIGAFVVGAVVLVVVGVLVLGSLKALFERPVRVVMFFDSDVNGLSVGAPLAFRGVKLGQVSNFQIKVGSGGKIAVYGELPRRLLNEDTASVVREAIKRGLRAQLATQSLLTGQLYISLNLMPDTPASRPQAPASVFMTPAELKRRELLAPDPDAIEIPTVPTTLQEWAKRGEELLNKISALPLDDMIKDAAGAMVGVKNLAESPDLRQTIHKANGLMSELQGAAKDARPMIASFTATSDTARGAVTDITPDLRKLAANLETTSDAVRGFMTDGQKLVRDVDAKVDPLAASFISTMETAKGTLGGVDGVLTERTNLGYQLGQAIQELTAAARSVRVLADYLEQHPEALIAGKGGAGGN
jgi:paraquat-inducible protein B